MRTTNVVQEAQTSMEVTDTAYAMGIDEGSTVFLMDALGKLYSRPAQAALREYLSNAVDAHVAKGGNLPPIQVTLPVANSTSRKQFLMIRDFGNGMNEEEFRTILSRYGASTKRDSNKLIGGFGLGAKAGFAVSDEFFMTSYQNGTGTRVRIFKDNQKQGYVDVVNRFSTSEPDGMLVEVPISKTNLMELGTSALFDKVPFFAAYSDAELDVMPAKRNGRVSVADSDKFSELSLAGKTVGWVSNDNKTTNNTYALVGKVVYPLDLRQILAQAVMDPKYKKTDFKKSLEMVQKFKRTQFLNIPIGSLDLPSSREEITYSERSMRTLTATISNYAVALQQKIQDDMNSKTTRLQVLREMVILEDAGFLQGLDSLLWKGEALPSRSLLSQSKLTYAQTHYGTDLSLFTNLSFHRGNGLNRLLLSLSDKSQYANGVFRVTVKNAKEKAEVQKSINNELLPFLITNKSKNGDVLFSVMAEDDVLYEWIFRPKELSIDDIRSAKNKLDWQNRRQQELAKEQAARKEAARKRAEAAKATRAVSMLSHFTINNRKGLTLTRNTVEKAMNGGMQKFYLSEHEVLTELNEITDAPLSARGLLFPFNQTMENTFTVIKEPGSRIYYSQSSNYLVKLRTMLTLFLPEGSKVFVLGKTRDIEEFKNENPDIESVVSIVKEKLLKDIKDNSSPLKMAYNASLKKKVAGADNFRSEKYKVTEFIKVLSKEEYELLPADMKEIGKRISGHTDASPAVTSVGLPYLKSFVEAFEAKPSAGTVYSPKADVKTLQTKYPLLMGGDFGYYYVQGLKEAMIDYLRMMDQR